MAVYHDGELVVDTWAGHVAPDQNRAVDADTIFPVFSSGKAVASTAVHRLVEQKKLDYDTRIADFWPEFDCNGKEDVRLWQIMSHRTGLFECPEFKDYNELADWELMCSRMAKMTPAWTPGTRTRYQSISYTWLIAEIAQRVDGRHFARIVNDEICGLAGINSLFFGTTDETEKRVATLMRGADLPPLAPGEVPLEHRMGYEVIRRACLPGFNCLTNARSLARHYAVLTGMCRDIPPLLTPETLSRATVLNRSADDPVPIAVGTWELFGLGYVLYGPKDNLGQIFGHGGYGGAEGLADVKNRLAVGFTKNLLHGEQPTRQKIYDLLGMKVRPW